jgi:translation initiation factor 3 subunit M
MVLYAYTKFDEVIRTGLLSGKLSQPSQTLHITRATHRAFEPKDWKELEKRLIGWKTDLLGVLDVIAGAKAKNAAAKSKSIETQHTTNTSDLGKAAAV